MTIGKRYPDEEGLRQMRAFRCNECEACKLVPADKPPCKATWYVYRNNDRGHPDFGHLRLLVVGDGCTFRKPPFGLGWHYWLEGMVDLATGRVVTIPKEDKTCTPS